MQQKTIQSNTTLPRNPKCDTIRFLLKNLIFSIEKGMNMKKIVLVLLTCGLCRAVLAEAPVAESNLPPEIQKPMAAVKAATPKAQADPLRPVYHFRPPAQWMNDLNGPIWYKGYYHIFYQHNPYGDEWGNMHWGHARSQNLVKWEHLPIALWPSKEKGEDHCFSGCAAIDGDGRPMLIYTSIGDKRAPEIWAATPDDDELLVWKKHPANPILILTDHRGLQIDDWRDPFVFKSGDKTFMVIGGHPKGGKGAIFVYEATNAELTTWTYRGIGLEGTEGNWECPNLFPLDGKWVLVYSPHGTVRYYVGQFDAKTCKFTPQSQGTMDYGDYYAPNCTEDPQGRRIMWGWIRGFPGGKGWNGCLTLPRALSLDPQGRLVQTPIREPRRFLYYSDGQVVPAFGRSQMLYTHATKPHTIHSLEVIRQYTYEVYIRSPDLALTAEFHPESNSRYGLSLRTYADGSGGIPVLYDTQARTLTVGNKTVDQPLAEGEMMTSLSVFLDRSVLEVSVNGGRVCVTAVIPYDPVKIDNAVVAERGTVELRSFTLNPLFL